MAFGSSVSADDHDDVGRGGREGTSSARKTIERRLEMLVSRINAAGGVDGSAAGPNVDGARPYFSSLLRTPIRPRDPDAWSRWSIDESRGGGETHLTTLRRGRAALVSFLVAIDTPGRENAVVRLLAPSPVPSYLGYLSPSEDYRTSRRREKEQVVHRSSYFLPAAEEGGGATLPPPADGNGSRSQHVREELLARGRPRHRPAEELRAAASRYSGIVAPCGLPTRTILAETRFALSSLPSLTQTISRTICSIWR
jgi:hypothetical protein